MKNDPQYLKEFVKKHPDNKMGWYLLGRQYEEQGKKGKALFCYKKAGEVFEAYEEKKLPKVPGEPAGALESQDSVEKKKAGSTAGRTARLAVILLLIFAGTAFTPGAPQVDTAKQAEISKAEVVKEADSVAQPEERQVFYAKGIENPEGLKQALSDMIFPKGSQVRYAVLAQAPTSQDGVWTLWPLAPQILLSELWSDQGSAATVTYHDAPSCNCQPSSAAQASAVVKAWKGEQEQLAVLRSAAIHMKETVGKLPAAAEGLAGDYPNNRLSGLSEEMRTAWPAISQALQESGGGANGDVPGGGSAVGTNGVKVPQGSQSSALSASPLTAPLEIIVDTSAHRLALVSGKTILRSYPVGLGGEKTPEGVFAVSEKVRNPNGSSTGAFGSRGMALSDTLYAIHGTDAPWTVGKDESHGCIRMLKDDIEELYDMTPLGTKVTITSGRLPADILREKTRFRLPRQGMESNPGKIYRWLD